MTESAAAPDTTHSFRAYFERGPLGALLFGISSGFPYAMIGATLTTRLAQDGIDNDVAERIKEIARLNHMPINDVLLRLLRQSLKLDAETLIVSNPRQDIARLAGAWGQDETEALRAAIAAIERLP